MNKKKCFALLAAAVFVAAVWYLATHAWIDGSFYTKKADALDLTEKEISAEHYDQVRAEFPDRQILWNVPFQGSTVPNDAKAVTVQTLTAEDVAMLEYLQNLETVDARGCTDYAQLAMLKASRPEVEVLYTVSVDGKPYTQDATRLEITQFTQEDLALVQYLPALTEVQAEECRAYDLLMELQAQYPALKVTYQVELGGRMYACDTTNLTLEGTDTAEMLEKLRYFPALEKVSVMAPDYTQVTMPQLTEAHPEVDFYWEKEVLGVNLTSEDTQLSYIPKDLDAVSCLEQELKNFPNLERVYLGYCKLDNDALAEYRNRVRPEYKVVWNILIGAEYIDTDATWFMPGKTGRGLMEHQAVLLKYYEDMICIDIGHKLVATCDFVRYMPNLKYLIMACSNVKDISPLATCQNLIYLELQASKVEDYSPLLECKALQDLNLSMTFGDPEPLYQMTWLKRLHWICHEHLREEFERALPDTELMLANEWVSVGQGWRDHQNYYDMRDILGMYYMPSRDK